MKEVDYKEYFNDLHKFINSKKRKGDWKVLTSGMDASNTYHKEYVFDNGDTFFEVVSLITEVYDDEVTFDVHGKKITKIIRIDVDVTKVEYWSTDDSASKYYYDFIN